MLIAVTESGQFYSVQAVGPDVWTLFRYFEADGDWHWVARSEANETMTRTPYTGTVN